MTITRRKLMSATTAAAALATLPRAGFAAPPSTAEAFRAAMAEQPWLLAYRSAEAERYGATATLGGRWPDALRGALYRNGPARHEIGDFRYGHWFDGDGMLQKYSLRPDGVSHAARLIETTKVQAEREAGRALYPGFASVPPDPAPVTSADVVNVGNISVLHHHGELLALWEAGSPWRMDADTLETDGLYSFPRPDTAPNMRGVPFSAHPRVEPDGTLWNFGYVSGAKLMILWHIDAQGRLVKAGRIPADPISMPHDFVVTSKHIVLLMPPFHYEGGASNFLDAHRWVGDDPTRVLVVDKDDFANHYWLEAPAQWVFHFGNAWEDRHGVIHFDAARADDPMAMLSSFRDIMRGVITPTSTSLHHSYRIDTKKRRIAAAPMFGPQLETEFPSIDPRVSTERNRRLVMLGRARSDGAPHPNLNTVIAFDYDSGKRDAYRYPDAQIPEEHLFVPRPGSAPETEGWVVGSAIDWQRGGMVLNAFDVNRVADGPIASAELPYALPMGLHGKFVHV